MDRSLALDVQRNQIAAFRALAEVQRDGDVVEDGPVVGAFTGLSAPFFNQIFVLDDGIQSVAAVGASVERIVAKARKRGFPFLVTVEADAAVSDAVHEACVSAGLHANGEPSPGMAMVMRSIGRLPVDVDAVVADDADAMNEVAKITERAYQVSESVARAVCHPALLHVDGMRWILLRHRGTAVAAAMSYVDGSTGGVYNVGVPPELQRRGFGEAVTWAAVRQNAAEGAKRTTLLASSKGRPLYERMGFHVVTLIRSYESPPG